MHICVKIQHIPIAKIDKFFTVSGEYFYRFYAYGAR